MIILGDVASPNASTSNAILAALATAKLNEEQSILFNLEGLITDVYSSKKPEPILFKHSSILDVFQNFDHKICALANNHTLDLPQFLVSTVATLNSKGYNAVGAGNIKNTDFEFTVFQEDGHKVYVYNACWDFLLYNQNTLNKALTVNVLDELKILRWVENIKDDDVTAKVIIYVHWSFDLEILPFPSYRRFAKSLIDAGVSLVVGAHSHCIQGGEVYKDGYIAYGLGNFFIPSNEYANGTLSFPKMSSRGWAIEWDISANTITNHWFDYSVTEGAHTLQYSGKEDFATSEILSGYSKFSSLTDREYVNYFKKHRRKKKLIPIFYSFEPSFMNSVKMQILKIRAKTARFLAEKGIIGWTS